MSSDVTSKCCIDCTSSVQKSKIQPWCEKFRLFAKTTLACSFLSSTSPDFNLSSSSKNLLDSY